MPVTFWTMLIGALALAGIFPLAGFWSKDGLLVAAYDTHHMWLFVVFARHGAHHRLLHDPDDPAHLLRGVPRGTRIRTSRRRR